MTDIIEGEYKQVDRAKLPSIRKDDLRELEHQQKLDAREDALKAVDVILSDGDDIGSKSEELRNAGVHESWYSEDEESRGIVNRHIGTFRYLTKTSRIKIEKPIRGNSAHKNLISAQEKARDNANKALGIYLFDINLEDDVGSPENAKLLGEVNRNVSSTRNNLDEATARWKRKTSGKTGLFN